MGNYIASLLAKIPYCNVSKIITKFMYVVDLKLSVAAIIQFKIQFDVEIKKTEVSLSTHGEQCQVDCLSILFLGI
jgi:hypothetical protein